MKFNLTLSKLLSSTAEYDYIMIILMNLITLWLFSWILIILSTEITLWLFKYHIIAAKSCSCGAWEENPIEKESQVILNWNFTSQLKIKKKSEKSHMINIIFLWEGIRSISLIALFENDWLGGNYNYWSLNEVWERQKLN